MKISVFTGPYFDFDDVPDPVIDGVAIPRRFWKIIAFVHDETNELCATGYEMSQEANLPTEEFVFGDFVSSHLNVSTQVSIARIQARTGLRFDDLASVDPLATEEEGVGADEPLTAFDQIRFF
jgi:endonuclease G